MAELHNPNLGPFEESFFRGDDLGGYSDVAGALELANVAGRGSSTAQKFLDRGFSLAGRSVLILGCAVGATVSHLRNVHLADAWGMDISVWATSNALEPDHVIQGDATQAGALDLVSDLAGVNRWDCVISEQLLPVFAQSEIPAITALWRTFATRRPALDWSGVIHYVHTHPIAGDPYLTLSLAEWNTLVDSSLSGGDRPDWVWRWADQAEAN